MLYFVAVRDDSPYEALGKILHQICRTVQVVSLLPYITYNTYM